MEKKEINTGMYGTTFSSGVFVGKLSTPTKMSLTDQTKVALLEYLTESDEFHKLVCDITGVERKQVKVSPELEKLKEDYSHMCESYEHEKQQRNDLLRKWREETAQRLDAERERDSAQRHHKFVMNELSSMLKEVECSSVRGIVDELKAERANGKLLAEENEQCRGEYDRLKLSYDKVCEEKKNLLSNYNYLNEKNKSKDKEYEVLQALYSDVLLTNTKLTKEKEKAERAKSETEKMYKTDFEYINKCNQNQAKTITKQMNELLEVRTELVEQKELVKKHMAKSEKLQAKLDKASKRYGELIKTISDRAIKSI
jgi:chromosome segregation ATPase